MRSKCHCGLAGWLAGWLGVCADSAGLFVCYIADLLVGAGGWTSDDWTPSMCVKNVIYLM